VREAARAAIWVLGCVIAARAADAAARRLALVNSDSELSRSVSLALSPWGVETIVVDPDSPGSLLPQALHRARALAQELGVDAIAWVSASSDESVLWVYSVEADHLASRLFSKAPPFDSPSAAAVALSLKTLLRTTAIAPEAERFGATPADEPRPPELVRIEGETMFRHFVSGMGEIRFGVQAAGFLRLPSARPGVSLGLSVGPGVAVETAAFSGHFQDWAVPVALREWFPIGKVVTLQPLIGATIRVASLTGSLVPGEGRVEVHRVDMSFDAGAFVDVRLGPIISLGVGGRLSYPLRYQRYLVNGQPVFELRSTWEEIGGHVGVNLL
jgi:hypothetical protein